MPVVFLKSFCRILHSNKCSCSQWPGLTPSCTETLPHMQRPSHMHTTSNCKADARYCNYEALWQNKYSSTTVYQQQQFRHLIPLLINNDVSLNTRGMLYSCCMQSSMLHGSAVYYCSCFIFGLIGQSVGSQFYQTPNLAATLAGCLFAGLPHHAEHWLRVITRILTSWSVCCMACCARINKTYLMLGLVTSLGVSTNVAHCRDWLVLECWSSWYKHITSVCKKPLWPT